MEKYDIYYCDLGNSTGSEQGGYRPCIILQNNLGNKYSPTTIIAPLTTQVKRPLPTHIMINMNNHTSCILTEQLRVIDKARIKKYYGAVTNVELQKKIDIATRVSLGLN